MKHPYQDLHRTPSTKQNRKKGKGLCQCVSVKTLKVFVHFLALAYANDMMQQVIYLCRMHYHIQFVHWFKERLARTSNEKNCSNGSIIITLSELGQKNKSYYISIYEMTAMM